MPCALSVAEGIDAKIVAETSGSRASREKPAGAATNTMLQPQADDPHADAHAYLVFQRARAQQAQAEYERLRCKFAQAQMAADAAEQEAQRQRAQLQALLQQAQRQQAQQQAQQQAKQQAQQQQQQAAAELQPPCDRPQQSSFTSSAARAWARVRLITLHCKHTPHTPTYRMRADNLQTAISMEDIAMVDNICFVR